MPEVIEQELTAQQAIKLSKEKIIRGITCPACNGELDIKEGMRSFNCKYCGTLLIVKGESGTLKYFVPKKLKRENAIKKASEWLGTGFSKARNLRTNSRIIEAFLVYIPYWRVSADVVGWIFGQEKRTTTSNGRTSTYYVDVERKIQKSFDRTYSACDVAELGVKKINLTGDEILPVNFEDLQKEGMMFNIISSEREALNFAKDNFAVESRNSVNLYNVSFEHYNLVRENINVVYYPLWVVRYSFANRTYQIVVDGEDGSICYGKAPGNNLYRAVTGIIGTGLGMFFMTLFGIFAVLGFADESPFVAFIIAFALGIFCIRWGYKKFRYGGEVEEGTGMEKEEKKAIKGLNKQVSKNQGYEIAKDVAASVVIGGIMSALLNSRR